MSDRNSSLSIMMIDDNDVDRMMGKRLAERSGFIDRYVGFPSALDALAHLSEADAPVYDVILLDQSMPNMDGVGFLREAKARLKERLSKTAVVMLTTILSEEDRVIAERSGMVTSFLSKPLSSRKMEDLQMVGC
jgi:CheY-like chemotaxis protein